MFNDLIHKLFNTYVSPLQLLLIIIGIAVCLVLLGSVLAYVCACYDEKKIKSHIIIKSLIIATSPLLSEFFYFIEKPMSDKIINIIFVLTVVVVLIWNVMSIGFIKGILFSIVNLGLAVIASIGIFTVIVFVIIGVAGWLFGGKEGETKTPFAGESKKYSVGDYSSTTEINPEYLTNVRTNESYYVTKNISGDTLYINGKVVRKVDSNRYIDDYGNSYISYDD